MDLTVPSRHRIVVPCGLAGGEDGRCGRHRVERTDGTRDEMTGPDRRHIAAGDVLAVDTPSGSDCGPPPPAEGNRRVAAAPPADCCRSGRLEREGSIGSITIQPAEMTAVYRQGGCAA